MSIWLQPTYSNETSVAAIINNFALESATYKLLHMNYNYQYPTTYPPQTCMLNLYGNILLMVPIHSLVIRSRIFLANEFLYENGLLRITPVIFTLSCYKSYFKT